MNNAHLEVVKCHNKCKDSQCDIGEFLCRWCLHRDSCDVCFSMSTGVRLSMRMSLLLRAVGGTWSRVCSVNAHRVSHHEHVSQQDLQLSKCASRSGRHRAFLFAAVTGPTSLGAVGFGHGGLFSHGWKHGRVGFPFFFRCERRAFFFSMTFLPPLNGNHTEEEGRKRRVGLRCSDRHRRAIGRGGSVPPRRKLKGGKVPSCG